MIEDVREENFLNGRPYKRVVLNSKKRKALVLAAAVRAFERCPEHSKRSIDPLSNSKIEKSGGYVCTSGNQISLSKSSQIGATTVINMSTECLPQTENGSYATTPESQRGEVGAAPNNVDQRGDVNYATPPPNKKEKVGAASSHAPKPKWTSQAENANKMQFWFTVVDPNTKKSIYINSVTHQVLDFPPIIEATREKLPPGWISIMNPENNKYAYVNIKKRRVEDNIKDVMATEESIDGKTPQQVKQAVPPQSAAPMQKKPASIKHSPQKEQFSNDSQHSSSETVQPSVKLSATNMKSSTKPVQQKQSNQIDTTQKPASGVTCSNSHSPQLFLQKK